VDGEQVAGGIDAPEDFEDVFRENFAQVFRFIARRVGTDLAEDLAAETFAMASVSGKALSPGFDFIADMRFVVTSDGGTHFTVVQFPGGESIQSVSCPTASHCVAVGVYDRLDTGMAPNLDLGVLLTSDDGGLAWRQHTWPAGFGPGPFPEVTCTDASHCAMIGFVEHDGNVTDQLGGVISGRDAVQYSVIGFSAASYPITVTSDLPATCATCAAPSLTSGEALEVPVISVPNAEGLL